MSEYTVQSKEQWEYTSFLNSAIRLAGHEIISFDTLENIAIEIVTRQANEILSARLEAEIEAEEDFDGDDAEDYEVAADLEGCGCVAEVEDEAEGLTLESVQVNKHYQARR